MTAVWNAGCCSRYFGKICSFDKRYHMVCFGTLSNSYVMFGGKKISWYSLNVSEENDMLSSGRKAGLVPAVGGDPHRGVWCAAGEEQFQEADESLRAELPNHRAKHELPAPPRGLGVDDSGQYLLVLQLSLSVDDRTLTWVAHVSSCTECCRCLFWWWSYWTPAPRSWSAWRTAGTLQHRLDHDKDMQPNLKSAFICYFFLSRSSNCVFVGGVPGAAAVWPIL